MLNFSSLLLFYGFHAALRLSRIKDVETPTRKLAASIRDSPGIEKADGKALDDLNTVTGHTNYYHDLCDQRSFCAKLGELTRDTQVRLRAARVSRALKTGHNKFVINKWVPPGERQLHLRSGGVTVYLPS